MDMEKDRILGISWRDHRSNEDVLREMNEERRLMTVIKRRQKNWIGHILRGESMFKEVVEGRFEGRKPRGRKRKSLLDDLKGNRSYHQLKRLTQDRRA